MKLNYLILLLLNLILSIQSTEFVTFTPAVENEKNSQLLNQLDFENLTSIVLVGKISKNYVNFIRQKNPNIKLQKLVGDLKNVNWEHYSSLSYLADQLIQEHILDSKLDGLNLDFEGSYYSKAANLGLVYFVKILSQKLKILRVPSGF